MNSPKEIYHNHRDHQRERILEAAEKLFIQHGIDHTSISAIASAARISRKTMYQYFTDKREVAWAIFQKIVEPWAAGREQPSEASGFKQLESFMVEVVKQLETSQDHFRFIVELDALYSRETSADRMRQVTGRAGADGEDWVVHMVRRGIADGSIRPDVDPLLASAALLNLLSGMNARFSLLGSLVTQEYGQPSASIYQEICRIFLRGLQAQP